jgi:hypothetical protein
LVKPELLTQRPEDDAEYHLFVGAFREELRKLGWAEGSNIRTDIRWANAGAASMRGFAEPAAGHGSSGHKPWPGLPTR